MKKKICFWGLRFLVLINLLSIAFLFWGLVLDQWLPSLGAYEMFLIVFSSTALGEVFLLLFMQKQGILSQFRINFYFEAYYLTTVVLLGISLLIPLIEKTCVISCYPLTVFLFVQSAIWWLFRKK